jgi:hypothetical protein
MVQISQRRHSRSLEKDYFTSLEKLRRAAAEAAMIRDLATDKTKRELFTLPHAHLNVLADEVEQAMKTSQSTTKQEARRWILTNRKIGRIPEINKIDMISWPFAWENPARRYLRRHGQG